MSKSTTTTVNTVIEVTEIGRGRYIFEENQRDRPFFHSEHFADKRKKGGIDLPGNLSLIVSYDEDKREIEAYLTLLGNQVGPAVSAGLDTGLELSVNLLLVKGEVGVFKEGSQLNARYGLTVVNPFGKDKEYSDTVKLFDL